MGPDPRASYAAILTIPNLISALRIALIPVVVWLLLSRGSEAGGIVLLALVLATDWVDGTLARRTGRVSELGKILDPVADRLAIGAGLIALVLDGAVPLWAALLILVRDAAILLAGALLLFRRRVRVEVRILGKVATFGLMVAVPSIAWGHFHLPLGDAATALGWIAYWVSIVEYYAATALYVGDARRALSGAPPPV